MNPKEDKNSHTSLETSRKGIQRSVDQGFPIIYYYMIVLPKSWKKDEKEEEMSVQQSVI